MGLLKTCVALGYVLLLLDPQLCRAITLPSRYDTVWTTQSTNASGSMPVGGGDVGLNAWAESGGAGVS